MAQNQNQASRQWQRSRVIRLACLGLGVLLAASFTNRLSPAALEIGTETQLVVDDYVIERMDGLRRQLNPLVKDARNPLMRPERPWEGQYTIPREVLRDDNDGLYKMWYSALETPGDVRKSRTAFATSEDGYAWHRPDLGLVEYNGSKRNNIIEEVFGEKLQDPNAIAPDGKPRRIHEPFGNGPKIIIDKHERDPARRFKALSYGRMSENVPAGIVVAYSADGLNWIRYPDNPVLTPTGDTNWLYGWDEAIGRYVAFIRPSQQFRTIGRSESPDFQRWTPVTQILAPDHDDLPGTQFYGMPVFRDRGMYFGMLSVFHLNSLMLDVQLTYSRDGKTWHRAGRRHPILTYGLPDEFDSHGLMPVRPIVSDGEIRVYYYGSNAPHALSNWEARAHPVQRSKTEQTWLTSRQGLVGVAASRRDGFISLDAGSDVGEMVTRPFVWRGTGLEVNANAAGGTIEVEMMSADGKPLPGLAQDQALPLSTDSLRHDVVWKGASPDAALQGRTVKIGFAMKAAKLFSFTVRR